MYEVDPQVLEISKALGEDTRFAIFRAIAASDGPLTVKDLVARFDMHHSAIRIHLNKLEEAGLIVSRKRHTPGAVGRPQLAFMPSRNPVCISLPTRNYELLSDLAIQLLSDGGMDIDAAIELGYDWGRRYMQRREHEYQSTLPVPFDQATDILLDELNSLGASFTKSRLNGKATCLVGQANCPFFEVARKHRPLVCALIQGAARGMLSYLLGQEVSWQSRKSLLEGDNVCQAEVTLIGAPVVN